MLLTLLFKEIPRNIVLLLQVLPFKWRVQRIYRTQTWSSTVLMLWCITVTQIIICEKKTYKNYWLSKPLIHFCWSDSIFHNGQWDPSKYSPQISTNQGSWRWHQMETCSTLLALSEGNSCIWDIGGFPSQSSVTHSIDVFFGVHLNKWLSK